MSPLLKNAVLSIQLGLEDFASKDERRIISAVRNLYAGVLLLCKEVLRPLSPPKSNDVLIKQKKKVVKDSGGVRFVGYGKKTIDRSEIKALFEQLNLTVDLSKLQRLAEIRNDIEHSHPSHAPALIQEAIADAMPVIQSIIIKALEKKPIDLLGTEAWKTLLDEAKVFKAEEDACKATLKKIQWNSKTLAAAVNELRCPNCSSSLLKNDSTKVSSSSDLNLLCSKCGKTADQQDVLEEALDQSLQSANYISIKDGGMPLLEDCPECGRKMYVVDENKCVNFECRFSLKGSGCAICGSTLSISSCDYDYGYGYLCSFCHHMISKDD